MKIREKEKLSESQIEYIKQPSMTVFGPGNILARGLFLAIPLYIFIFLNFTLTHNIDWFSDLLSGIILMAPGMLVAIVTGYFFWRHARRWSWNTNKWNNFEAFQRSEKRWHPWGTSFLVIRIMSQFGLVKLFLVLFGWLLSSIVAVVILLAVGILDSRTRY